MSSYAPVMQMCEQIMERDHLFFSGKQEGQQEMNYQGGLHKSSGILDFKIKVEFFPAKNF